MRDEVPEATKAVALLELALEIEEDRYFASIAKKRLASKVQWIPDNDEIWK